MPRMNILNAVEREAFDSPPVFNSFQRKQYFDFPSKLRRFVAGLRSPAWRKPASCSSRTASFSGICLYLWQKLEDRLVLTPVGRMIQAQVAAVSNPDNKKLA